MVSALQEDLASSVAQRIQPTFGYYRQPNGWITISPNTRLERLKYTEEGWTYLAQYGAFDMTAYTANHPFEGLFMFGGAKELLLDQVVKTGLYMNPPLVPRCRQHLTQFHRSHTQACWMGATKVVFPQLEGIDMAQLWQFPCGFCERGLPTRQALEQHQSVAHAKPLGNIQMGKSLGDALSDSMKKSSPVEADPERAALLERIAVLEKEQAETLRKRAAAAKMRAAKKTRPTSSSPKAN